MTEDDAQLCDSYYLLFITKYNTRNLRDKTK